MKLLQLINEIKIIRPSDMRVLRIEVDFEWDREVHFNDDSALFKLLTVSEFRSELNKYSKLNTDFRDSAASLNYSYRPTSINVFKCEVPISNNDGVYNFGNAIACLESPSSEGFVDIGTNFIGFGVIFMMMQPSDLNKVTLDAIEEIFDFYNIELGDEITFEQASQYLLSRGL